MKNYVFPISGCSWGKNKNAFPVISSRSHNMLVIGPLSQSRPDDCDTWWMELHHSHFHQYCYAKTHAKSQALALTARSSFYARKQPLLSARLRHRNSVCLSLCHTGGSVNNGAS